MNSRWISTERYVIRKAPEFCKLRVPASALESELIFVLIEDRGDRGVYRVFQGVDKGIAPTFCYLKSDMRTLANHEKLF